MSATPPTPPPLAYHDYALLLTSLDAEWTRSQGKAFEAFEVSKTSFEDSCNKYRKSVTETHGQPWKQGRNKHHLDDGGEMDDFFFKPAIWLPCGHADLLTAVIIDDLDSAQTIVELCPKTAEEITLAFCPKVDYKASLPTDCSKAEMLVDPTWFVTSGCWQSSTNDAPLLVLVRLKLEGLLIMGRSLRVQNAVFRLIAKVIGEIENDKIEFSDGGNLYTKEELQSMRIALLDLQDEEEVGLMIACRNFSTAMALNACLQNLTVDDMLRDNVALKNELLPALADIAPDKTEEELLLPTDSSIEPLLENVAKLKNITKLKKIIDETATEKTPLINLISGTHLFRWTRSTLAYSYGLFQDAYADAEAVATCAKHSTPPPPRKLRAGGCGVKVTGIVRAMVGLHVPPGHRTMAEEILRKAALATGEREQDSFPALYQMAGTTDLLICPALESTNVQYVKPVGQVVHCLALIEVFAAVIQQFEGHTASITTEPKLSSRQISGWISQLQVPVPQDIHKGLSEYHRSVIGKLLAYICKALFPHRDRLETSDQEAKPQQFSQSNLSNRTRNCGFPLALRRSLMFLYENFGSILANPRLFEVVLDYANFFASLNTMLITVLPHELGVEGDKDNLVPDEEIGMVKVDRPQVEQLAMVLDALSTSMELRLRRVYPDQLSRDWSIDFRSSLSQVIGAGEACLKSAAGFVRKYFIKPQSELLELSTHVPVCVISRLSMSPGVKAHPIPFTSHWLNPQDLQNSAGQTRLRPDRPRLAVIDTDVFHITDLRSYPDFFHEAYHLIYSDPIAATDDRSTFDRSEFDLPRLCEEVFVQMLMWLTVFDEDQELMMLDFCSCLSSALENGASHSGASSSPQSRLDRDINSFAENLSTVVIAMLCGRAARSLSEEKGTTKKIDLDERNEIPELNLELLPDIDLALDFLDQCMNQGQPLLENQHLWNNVPAARDPSFVVEIAPKDTPEEIRLKNTVRRQREVRRRFGCIYDGLFGRLPTLWTKAHEVFAEFVKEIGTPRVRNNEVATDWEAYVIERNGIESEVRERFTNHSGDGSFAPVSGCALDKTDGEAVDGTLLVLCLLRCYLRYVYHWSEQSPPKDGTLQRILDRPWKQDPRDTRKPFFDPEKCYGNFLLDRCTILPFSCSPSARRHRLGVDTTMIKMLWDLTSRQRRRRLRTLLATCDKLT